MALLSQKEVLNLKLGCIPLPDLKILSQNLGVSNIGGATKIIKRVLERYPNEKVIPTIKNIKGIDIFFDGQPFDLKVTYLPRKYNPIDAVKNPSNLAIWMYENQGAQRFGSDNRLFVVLLDKDNPERSWNLKRDFILVFQKIDNFFDKETVSKKDEIVFTFGRKIYTAVSKVLIITK